MPTRIEGNGSKWAGEAEDPLERLYERLSQYTLEPSLEPCFIEGPDPRAGVRVAAGKWVDGPTPLYPELPGCYSFCGNFHELSAGFRIVTNEPAVIDRLRTLILANMATDAYQRAKAERAAWEAKRNINRRLFHHP